MTRLALLCAAPIAAFALAACGDDDGGGGEEEAAITETIETSVLSTDPADCTRLQTQAFMEQVNFATGEEAVQDCEEDVADTSNDPDSVDVSEVDVGDGEASANVAFTGGPFDGSTVSVDLVKDGEQWKLDAITDVPELNLESFQQSFVDELRADESIPQQIADCMADAIGEVSEDQVEDVLVSGSEEDLVGLFGDCIPGQ
jgi:hypothetical protein